VSRESEIDYRLRIRDTGPFGETEFARHAPDDLEWALGLLDKFNRAVCVAREEEIGDVEDGLKDAEETLKDAHEHKKHIEELETERDKLKEDLETKTEDLKAAEGALKLANQRIDELESESPTAAE
jgi:predicted  nucleic acid-binding Zn-ribbon protein